MTEQEKTLVRNVRLELEPSTASQKSRLATSFYGRLRLSSACRCNRSVGQFAAVALAGRCLYPQFNRPCGRFVVLTHDRSVRQQDGAESDGRLHKRARMAWLGVGWCLFFALLVAVCRPLTLHAQPSPSVQTVRSSQRCQGLISPNCRLCSKTPVPST